MSRIHPFALVAPDAEIGPQVTIGPFSVIEPGAVIGEGCSIAGRVTIKTGTILGPENQVAEGTVLGGRPQHLKGGDQLGLLRIGRGNVIRENVTIHRGLSPNSDTVVGDHNLIMVNAHVAHDCHIGDRTVIVNNVLLAGHVTVGDRAYVSGAVAVHQFCRIGSFAMVGGQAHLSQDVPPFVTIDGKTTKVVGLNVIGLRRAGFSDHDLQELKRAYRTIYRSGLTWSETLRTLASTFVEGPAAEFYPFLAQSKRGFVSERRTPRGATVSYHAHVATEESERELRKAG